MDAPLATASVFSRLANEPGRALLTVRGQHFAADSPPPLGGPNESVNPVELLLAALAACGTFICETVASEQGIPLHSVSVTAAGALNPRVVCCEPLATRFQPCRVRLALNAPDLAQREALLAAFKARCPVYATLARAAPVEVTLA
jgi:uncharacterized OsmC-like protein